MTTRRLPDACGGCGAELDTLAGEPCPACGSTLRSLRYAHDAEIVSVMGLEVSLKVSRVWDAFSLAFAAVIYGIVATVLGVLVAKIGPAWLTVLYAVVMLVGLALGLLVWHQSIIRWIRKLPAHPNHEP
jgi:hypothetical protein